MTPSLAGPGHAPYPQLLPPTHHSHGAKLGPGHAPSLPCRTRLGMSYSPFPHRAGPCCKDAHYATSEKKKDPCPNLLTDAVMTLRRNTLVWLELHLPEH